MKIQLFFFLLVTFISSCTAQSNENCKIDFSGFVVSKSLPIKIIDIEFLKSSLLTKDGFDSLTKTESPFRLFKIICHHEFEKVLEFDLIDSSKISVHKAKAFCDKKIPTEVFVYSICFWNSAGSNEGFDTFITENWACFHGDYKTRYFYLPIKMSKYSISFIRFRNSDFTLKQRLEIEDNWSFE